MLDEFIIIQRFEKLHKDRYDYSQVEYVGINKKVKIGCKKHGYFEQTPAIHLNGSGCPICNTIKITKDEFIKRSNAIHKNYYDYSLSNFRGTNYYVDIICPLHGKFKQKPSNHMIGQKCPYCSNKKWNTEIFKNKAIEIHGNL